MLCVERVCVPFSTMSSRPARCGCPPWPGGMSRARALAIIAEKMERAGERGDERAL